MSGPFIGGEEADLFLVFDVGLICFSSQLLKLLMLSWRSAWRRVGGDLGVIRGSGGSLPGSVSVGYPFGGNQYLWRYNERSSL